MQLREWFGRRSASDEVAWADWRWQMRNRIRTLDALRNWIDVTPQEEAGIHAIEGRYDWFVTPHYASLMDPLDPNCPIRLQALPSLQEMQVSTQAETDPVGDTQFRVTNRVVHKYKDRAIFLVTSICPTLCRYCTRKHHTTSLDSSYFGTGESASMQEDFDYIAAHPEIRDVLLTGGDPLSYGDDKLEYILQRLRSISHIEIIRIGSRYPVLCPQRITSSLCEMLARYHPVWLNTHFNHPKEISDASVRGCELLLAHGVPVGNQSVLLRGVNDSSETMRALCHELVKIRVRPYYLYHCDNVTGVSHFQTSIDAGKEIMRSLIGHTTGFAVPQYIITTMEGKISLAEDTFVSASDDGNYMTLRGYKGAVVTLQSRPAVVK